MRTVVALLFLTVIVEAPSQGLVAVWWFEPGSRMTFADGLLFKKVPRESKKNYRIISEHGRININCPFFHVRGPTKLSDLLSGPYQNHTTFFLQQEAFGKSSNLF